MTLNLKLAISVTLVSMCAHTTVRYGDWHEQKCRYFLNYFPCPGMSRDARKPNIMSQTKCTLYKESWKTAFLLVKTEFFPFHSVFSLNNNFFISLEFIWYQKMQNFIENSKNVVKRCKSDFVTIVNFDELGKLVYFDSKSVVF